ncbi:MAG: hypothetical protein IPK16_31820 [Anaerolineales bacterium]|nr:hypothetical protein [Anaerolineales bacterium]
MHYAITASFVTAYMQFAPHSLVFFNGCSSMSAGASALRTAFGQAGATMYLGWTLTVMDPAAVRAGWFLFDRLLGSNFYQPETPDQRPFDLQSVMTDIQNRGYDQSVYCNNKKPTCPPGNVVTSTLQLQALTSITDDQFSLLTPTIKRMETDDPPCCDEPRPIIWLNLEGQFGSVQGDVLVDNQSLPILSWSCDLIRAELPAHGPGSAGPVTVTVRGHASNAAPLTEWRGRVTWDEEYDRLGGGPGPYAEVACDLHFRSNFHAARDASGGQPVWPAVAAVEESQDSECIWSMGGASNWVDPSTGDEMRGVLSGSGTLAWRPSNATPGPYLGFSAVIEPEQKRLVMSLVGTDQGTWRVYRNGKLSHSSKQPLYGTGPLTLPLDNDYNIKAGSSTFEFALGPVTTQWGSIPARFAPKGSTPAQQ